MDKAVPQYAAPLVRAGMDRKASSYCKNCNAAIERRPRESWRHEIGGSEFCPKKA